MALFDHLNWFIPPHLRADPARGPRAKAFAATFIAGAAIIWAMFVVFLWLRRNPTTLELALFSAAAMVPSIAPFVLRFSRNPNTAITVGNLIAITILAVWAGAWGGISSPVSLWFIAVMATVGSMGNSRVMWMTLVADLVIVTVLFAAQENQLLPPSPLTADEFANLHYLSVMGVLVVIAVAMTARLMTQRRMFAFINESQQRLQLIVDGVPAAIAHLDCSQATPRYSFVNARYAQSFGKASEEIVGMSVTDLLGPATARDLEQQWQAVLAGETVEYERSIDRPNERSAIYRIILQPQSDAAGVVRGVYVFALDDTARRQALEAVQKSEARLAQASALVLGL